ncbi:MAG: LuxR C-terminal-related transcriptional regulator [Gaiellaceae bacterium]
MTGELAAGGEPLAAPLAVVVCAATRLYRDGLSDALRFRPDVSVLGTAAGLDDCVSIVEQARPDVVLVDTSMPEASLTIRALGRLSRAPRVVALAVPDAEDAVLACVEAGAAAFVTVEESIEDLVATLVGLARGEAHASPRLTAALLRRLSHLAARSDGEDVEALTSRELQVGALLGDGLSNKEIARALQIELPTVKNHVHQVLRKLGVARRAQVGPRLRELGLHARSGIPS